MKSLLTSLVLCVFAGAVNAQPGCTDPLANNYNASATANDGSCTYNGATIGPKSSKNLGSLLPETSGLIHWNNSVWTHNDDTDTRLYELDTASAATKQTYTLPQVTNRDWEEISQDDNYVYIGDFGNNANGNRTDLHILRIEKNSLLANTPEIDTIWFSYSNQTDFSGSGGNNTDFDCEAFIVGSDSIYLFTKQWVSNKTSYYSLAKTPGTHTANLRGTINIAALATGATYLEDKKLVVLLCYTEAMQPFMYLLYDYHGNDFSSGNKRRINLNINLHQAEGITTGNGLKYYVSNEAIESINVPAKLHTFELTNFLSAYLNNVPTGIIHSKKNNELAIFPNPASEMITIKVNAALTGTKAFITDISGKMILSFELTGSSTSINISELPAGSYFINMEAQEGHASFVKK